MKTTILGTEQTYRKLLAATDDTEREQIYRKELVEPFSGLIAVMGGGDGLAKFQQWNLSPNDWTGDKAVSMRQNVDALSKANAWKLSEEALHQGLRAFQNFSVPECDLVFGLMLADLTNTPLQRGYTGFGAIPGWIMTIYGVPDAYNLERIQACTVHELHHNILARIFPHQMATWTVGEYMIMEGLAESFAAELYGEDKIGYWVTDFDMAQMTAVKEQFRGALEKTGFSTIRGYIFGDDFAGAQYGIEKVGVPAFSGYALGYHTVQAYLQRTGKTVAEATFVPAREIIEESRYFA
ncbi:MAG: DUF2268 domain-containing protein [Candidatus Kapabacteria bacterium]|jgi:uncharacterized protein YjaZ|nr:DUF2268 domain-containing protein [Candidatus Kapabacteria bacterium]